MTPHELYQAGRLGDALAASTQEVKTRPADVTARYYFCQLLCISGQLERADVQLETISRQATEPAVEVALFRQLIRAETWRRQFYSDGHLPEFRAQPPEHIERHLRASIALREGNTEEAAALLAEAAGLRPPVAGTCNSEPFGELLDPNDLTASFFEVLTAGGKYYWLPFESLEAIEFHPMKRPRDLLWRPARITFPGGTEGEVFFTTIYADTYKEADEQLLLGRMTDWRESGGPVSGVGQRLLLFGEIDRPILEINDVQFGKPGD
jgi:type VI secretion system protein ImpE